VNDPAREIEVFGVYRVRADGLVERLVDDIPRPNGIVFSPDERTLYVSSRPRRGTG
jgi:gluconolactonase